MKKILCFLCVLISLLVIGKVEASCGLGQELECKSRNTSTQNCTFNSTTCECACQTNSGETNPPGNDDDNDDDSTTTVTTTCTKTFDNNCCDKGYAYAVEQFLNYTYRYNLNYRNISIKYDASSSYYINSSGQCKKITADICNNSNSDVALGKACCEIKGDYWANNECNDCDWTNTSNYKHVTKRLYGIQGAGIRYTIVDDKGDPISDLGFSSSFTFINDYPDGEVWYNAGTGDQSKKAVSKGSGSFVKGSPKGKYYSHQDLMAAYDKVIEQWDHPNNPWTQQVSAHPKAIPRATMQSVGYKDYIGNDFQWFNGLKDDDPFVQFADTIAFLVAISSLGDVDDSKLNELVWNICNEKVQVNIIAEPMLAFGITYYTEKTTAEKNQCASNCLSETQVTASSASLYGACQEACKAERVEKQYPAYFGTLADIGRMMYDSSINSTIASDVESMDNLIRGNEVGTSEKCGVTTNSVSIGWKSGTQFDQTNTLKVLNEFGRANRFSNDLWNNFYYKDNTITYSNESSFLADNTGMGMWANGVKKFAGACGAKCSYDFNTHEVVSMTNQRYTSATFPNPNNKYKNIQEFAFDSLTNGGLGCCYSFKYDPTYSSMMNQTEWKEAYEAYCDYGSCNWNKTDHKLNVNGYSYSKGESVYGRSLSEYALSDNGANCCSTLKNEIMNGELSDWMADYNRYCNGLNAQNCCTTKKVVNPNDIKGDVHNCCLDNAPTGAEQTALNDMFCRDNNLQVDGYFPVCGADEGFRLDLNGSLSKDGTINDYCREYCSERALIEIPDPMTAYVGRYFTLKQLTYSTDYPERAGKVTGPWYRGFKRCRVLTSWDQWIKDYENAINEEVSAYNEYAKANAIWDLYKKAQRSPQDPTLVLHCDSVEEKDDRRAYVPEKTCGVGEINCTPHGSEPACHAHCDAIPAEDFTTKVNYTIFKFDAMSREYKTVRINEANHKDQSIYRSIDLIVDQVLNNPKAYQGDLRQVYNMTAAENSAASFKTNKISTRTRSDSDDRCSCHTQGSCDWSTYIPSGDLALYRNEDVEAVTATHYNTASQKLSALKLKTQAVKNLEEKLTACEAFFTLGGQYSSNIYSLDPKLEFSYTQTYMGDNGKEETDEIKIPFKGINDSNNGACTYSGPWIAKGDYENPTTNKGGNPDSSGKYWGYVNVNASDSDDSRGGSEIFKPNYSDKYTPGNKYYEAMRGVDLSKLPSNPDEYITDAVRINKYMRNESTEYKAEKKFTEDAKYRADCLWDDEQDTKYTLAPSGLVYGENIDTSKYRSIVTDKNVTKHEREYFIHAAVYEGTYETHWRLKGIGENGKFDSYIENNGETCSVELGETPSEGGNLTCTLQVKEYSSVTGKCNPIKTTNYGSCDAFDIKYPYLQFKIVDPENPFPTATQVSNGYKDAKTNETYAANWVTSDGKAVLLEITNKAKEYDTFSPDNLSDSYTLNPRTTTAIQAYNTNALSRGGYSDFTLNCNCPTETIKTTKENNKWLTYEEIKSKGVDLCDECRSQFLERLNNFISNKNQTSIPYPNSLGD